MDIKRSLEDELTLSGSIVLAGEVVVPRFVVEVPGETAVGIFLPLPDDLRERQRRLQLVRWFLAWKGASSFIMSTELIEPDAVVSVAVSRDNVTAGLRMIGRKQLMLGPTQWLDGRSIGDEIPALMPKRAMLLSDDILRDLIRVFGPQGEFRVEPLQ